MKWILLFFVAVIAGSIFYQDSSKRSVAWIYFPLLAIAGMIYSMLDGSLWSMVSNAGVNSAFLLVQWLLLIIYYKLKEGQTNIINRKIGSGDVWFFCCTGFFFSPLNFMLFFCLSLVFVLLVAAAVKIIGRSGYKTVPLAGLQAVFLVIALVWLQLINYNVTNDDYILSCLNGAYD